MRHQLGLERRQPHFKGGQLAGQAVQQFARRLRHIGLAGNPLEQLLDLLRPRRPGHAELCRVSADRIAQHRALLGQQIAIGVEPFGLLDELVSRSRTFRSISAACSSRLLIGTKRIPGRLIASPIASASIASFLPRLT